MQPPEEFYVAIESAHPSRAVAMIAARDADIRAEAVRWIPVGEALPEFRARVLVWVPDWKDAIVSGRYQDGASWFWEWPDESSLWNDSVTHWMPLPDCPPAAERSDADG
jgi:hypothetical protein